MWGKTLVAKGLNAGSWLGSAFNHGTAQDRQTSCFFTVVNLVNDIVRVRYRTGLNSVTTAFTVTTWVTITILHDEPHWSVRILRLFNLKILVSSSFPLELI
jgi:hypothetical protein